MSDFGFDEYNGLQGMGDDFSDGMDCMQYGDGFDSSVGNYPPVTGQQIDNGYNQGFDPSYYQPMTGWNNGAGVYDQQNQFNFDNQQLLSLGFTQEEINTLLYIVNCGGKVTPSALQQWGLPYEQAKKIKYMYDIIIGRVIVDSTEDLVKHLRKMFGQHRRIGLSDLKTTTINVLPRRCLVAGIPDRFPYSIYNSKNYQGMGMTYDVLDISSKKILVRTKRKPQLKYGSSRKLLMVQDLDNKKTKFTDDENTLTKAEKEDAQYIVSSAVEIRRVTPNGIVEVAFDKKVARMCNRFIIVASLKRPEYFLWLYEIIAIEGTKIYVYAKTASSGENVKYNGGTMRVYDYGFNGTEIKDKTLKAATEVYQKICGVFATEYPGNSDFVPLEEPKRRIDSFAQPQDNTSDEEFQ